MSTSKSAPFVRRKFRQETFFHSYIVRPLAQEIVAVLWNTQVTPNQLTFFRVFLNIVALICFTQALFWQGFIFFQTHEIIDHADGMLARMKNIRSNLGATVETISDTLFSSAFGFFGLVFAYAGYQLEANPIYFVLYGLVAMSYAFGSYFSKLLPGSLVTPANGGLRDGLHVNHDKEEYLNLLDPSPTRMLHNWVRTAYTWQNQFLLWGALLYFPMQGYGVNTLLVGFLAVCILSQAYWLNALWGILKQLKSKS